MHRVLAIMSLGLILPCGATAQGVLKMGDVGIVQQPQPASYQPEGNFDLADQGKRFDIACTIGGDGRLTACRALDNDLVDQNFIAIALDNADEWIVQPRDHFGRPTAGQIFIMTCQFKRSDELDAPQSLAAADGK